MTKTTIAAAAAAACGQCSRCYFPLLAVGIIAAMLGRSDLAALPFHLYHAIQFETQPVFSLHDFPLLESNRPWPRVVLFTRWQFYP